MMYVTCAVGYNCGDRGTPLMSKVGKTVLWLLAALAAVWIATHWLETHYPRLCRHTGRLGSRAERLKSQVAWAEPLDVVQLLVVLVEVPLFVLNKLLKNLFRDRIGVRRAGDRGGIVVASASLLHQRRFRQHLLGID